MNYLITGGTGFIGAKLVEEILSNGHKVMVLSRNKNKPNSKTRAICSLLEIDKNEKIDCIINLAGEGIADKRWTQKQKTILLESRVKTTKEIIELISKLKTKPSCFISASAIGFYGASNEKELDENSPCHDEFTHQLCTAWEAQAFKACKFGVRTCITRFGIVLEKNGGALKKMLPAFKLGLGGKIGDGKQFMSWIHRKDAISAINFLINNKDLSGSFNLTAPNAVTNSEFSKTLAKILNRPAFFNMPEAVVKILFGEMGEALLVRGQNVVPKNLLAAGFEFKFKNLNAALEDIC